MDKVIISTVTYNSSHFLKRLVEAVSLQTFPVFKIVVVDNASTDAHRKVIKELAISYSFVEVVTAPENLGGAGGFEMGIRYILDNGYDYDWIWIMDDDAFPMPDCLEKLLAYSDLDHTGALLPMIFGVELQKYQFMHHKKESKYLNRDIAVGRSLDDFPEITEVETNAFVGPLISRSAIAAVGVPNGSLFIYGDDTEYMYRVSRRFKLYLIKSAVINHRDIFESNHGISPSRYWKEYYMYRNRILFITEFQPSKSKRIIGYLLVMKRILREEAATLMHTQYKGFKAMRCACLLHAFWDGIRGISGKTIDPEAFMRKANRKLKKSDCR